MYSVHYYKDVVSCVIAGESWVLDVSWVSWLASFPPTKLGEISVTVLWLRGGVCTRVGSHDDIARIVAVTRAMGEETSRAAMTNQKLTNTIQI